MKPTRRLAPITIVVTLVYLELAILGWGGFAAFFSHPARIALAVALCALSGVALTALMVPPLLARIRAEETLLRTQFAGEYSAYCTRTSRLIPRIY